MREDDADGSPEDNGSDEFIPPRPEERARALDMGIPEMDIEEGSTGAAAAGREEWCPGPAGAVWRWNLT